MANKILANRNYAGCDMSDMPLGNTEYRECSFEHTNLRRSHLENSVFLSCDFNADLVGATFRLSCKQGSGNKLDDMRAKMFLYWMLQMFNLPDELRLKIEDVIGSSAMRHLKGLFDQETVIY